MEKIAVGNLLSHIQLPAIQGRGAICPIMEAHTRWGPAENFFWCASRRQSPRPCRVSVLNLKKENKSPKRGMGGGHPPLGCRSSPCSFFLSLGGQGPPPPRSSHMHEQDFGRTIRSTGGLVLLKISLPGGSPVSVSPCVVRKNSFVHNIHAGFRLLAN